MEQLCFRPLADVFCCETRGVYCKVMLLRGVGRMFCTVTWNKKLQSKFRANFFLREPIQECFGYVVEVRWTELWQPPRYYRTHYVPLRVGRPKIRTKKRGPPCKFQTPTQGSLFPPMVGGMGDFQKNFPTIIGERMVWKFSPPWAGGWWGKFLLPHHHGGEVDMGWPAAGGKFW